MSAAGGGLLMKRFFINQLTLQFDYYVIFLQAISWHFVCTIISKMLKNEEISDYLLRTDHVSVSVL
jgi:hypothetical protein